MSQPAHKIRIGLLCVTIWKNQDDKGVERYSVTPSRSYKKGDKWQETGSFGFDDLLTIAQLLEQAWSWIARELVTAGVMRRAKQDAEAAEE